jgi:hypothetical protein
MIENISTAQAAFRAAVRSVIARQVSALLKDGTVGMGEDNLYAVCVRHFPREGGPRGTNAAYYMRQLFAECVRESGPKVRAFILPPLVRSHRIAYEAGENGTTGEI